MKKTGFTLIETIVVVGITALIMTALSVMIAYFYRTNAYTLQQSIATQQARQGVQDAVKYLREASYGSDGSYPIAQAATSSIIFYANVNASPEIERVTYSLIHGAFYRTIAEPVGTIPSYVGVSPATTTIATSVVNNSSTPIFTYYDDKGNVLTYPINVSKIASVHVSLIIDVNVARSPTAYTLTGTATLRNLKAQL